MNVGREEECLETLARLRNKSKDDIGVRIEFLEIKAIKEFETRTVTEKYPHLQDGSAKSRFLMGVNEYKSLVTNRSLLKRSIVACLTMTFQQCKSKKKAYSKFLSTDAVPGNGVCPSPSFCLIQQPHSLEHRFGALLNHINKY